LDGGTTWSAWSDITAAGAIPGLDGKDVSNGRLQCRQKLYTNTGYSKGLYTPELFSYIITVNGAAHSKSFTVVIEPEVQSINSNSKSFTVVIEPEVQSINFKRSIDFSLNRVVDEKTFYGKWERTTHAPSIWTRVTR
jgi:hypothetical protein